MTKTCSFFSHLGRALSATREAIWVTYHRQSTPAVKFWSHAILLWGELRVTLPSPTLSRTPPLKKLHKITTLSMHSREASTLISALVFSVTLPFQVFVHLIVNYQEWKFTTYFICALKVEKNTGFFVTRQSMCVQNTSFDLCCDLWPAEFFGQMVCYQGDLCIENYTAKGGDEIWYVRIYRHLAIYRKCVIFSQKVVLPCFILIDSQHIYHF